MSSVDDRDKAALEWLEATVPNFREAITTSAKFRACIISMLPLWRMQVAMLAIGAVTDEDAMTLAARYAERTTRSIVLTGDDAEKIKDLLGRAPHRNEDGLADVGRESTTKGVVADSEEGMRRGE